MIAVAIGIVIIAIMIMGMFILYADERDRIEQTREVSTGIQGDRIREDVGLTLNTDDELVMTSDWGGSTEVTGLMVRCDDGRVITRDATINIPSSGGKVTNGTDTQRIRAMLAECNAP